ncbi:hypothetical protein CXG81DRAFT_16316 [Caulochytrium protostelioides]|uniref:Uncharacterized protein n=1 Tax=Caulochytrium protostelioides TaxID=1555241 RepID=A0A4V1IVK2_9FUNG|nr:hypothetical protein CXG81DRAFT_16316 [Caulochytrium protostelioides]|eukprot:RKP04349.1 hypothetical protein CXG81DRAFT_16316 [Caulochytrium protostelioides]
MASYLGSYVAKAAIRAIPEPQKEAIITAITPKVEPKDPDDADFDVHTAVTTPEPAARGLTSWFRKQDAPPMPPPPSHGLVLSENDARVLRRVQGMVHKFGDGTGAIRCYLIFRVACEVGLPDTVQAKMLANIAFNGTVAWIPLASTFIEQFFRVNTRNALILESFLIERRRDQYRVELGRMTQAEYDAKYPPPRLHKPKAQRLAEAKASSKPPVEAAGEDDATTAAPPSQAAETGKTTGFLGSLLGSMSAEPTVEELLAEPDDEEERAIRDRILEARRRSEPHYRRHSASEAFSDAVDFEAPDDAAWHVPHSRMPVEAREGEYATLSGEYPPDLPEDPSAPRADAQDAKDAAKSAAKSEEDDASKMPVLVPYLRDHPLDPPALSNGLAWLRSMAASHLPSGVPEMLGLSEKPAGEKTSPEKTSPEKPAQAAAPQQVA